jgi:Sigma-70 region 2
VTASSPHIRPDDARQVELSLRDPECFGVVFDRYFGEIHRYAARRLGRDAADDVAAETFLTAFRSRRRFDASRGTVRAWLYGIATNHMSVGSTGLFADPSGQWVLLWPAMVSSDPRHSTAGWISGGRLHPLPGVAEVFPQGIAW